ncbi:Cilia- and flagella-associated protein 47, partial [Irineochytrium annulatum]
MRPSEPDGGHPDSSALLDAALEGATTRGIGIGISRKNKPPEQRLANNRAFNFTANSRQLRPLDPSSIAVRRPQLAGPLIDHRVRHNGRDAGSWPAGGGRHRAAGVPHAGGVGGTTGIGMGHPAGLHPVLRRAASFDTDDGAKEMPVGHAGAGGPARRGKHSKGTVRIVEEGIVADQGRASINAVVERTGAGEGEWGADQGTKKVVKRERGSRTTIFTDLSSTSYHSMQAAAAKVQLKDYFAVRVDPPEAVITNYEPGSRCAERITVRNFSPHIQRITLHPPRTKLFRLTGPQSTLDTIMIAPGLSVDIDVEFLAPLSTVTSIIAPPNTALQPQQHQQQQRHLQHTTTLIDQLRTSSSTNVAQTMATATAALNPNMATTANSTTVPLTAAAHQDRQDPSLMRHEDILGVEVAGGDPITVKLLAFPAGPRLVFAQSVDFGLLVGAAGQAARANAATNSGTPLSPPSQTPPLIADRSPQAEDDDDAADQRSLGAVEAVRPSPGVVAARWLEVRNVGGRIARFRLAVGDSSRVRVTPSLVTLGHPGGRSGASGLPDSTKVRVELLSSTGAALGRVWEEVRVELENPLPCWEDEADAGEARHGRHLKFLVTANVAGHKLRLRNADNTHDLDPRDLRFGVIYYSQRACLPSKLENRGPTVIRWVITHAGESSPMVPPASGGQRGRGHRGSPGSEDSSSDVGSHHPSSGSSSMSLDSAGAGVAVAGASGAGNKEEAENKASMSVVPSEGVLQPYQTSDIVFNFAPRFQEPGQGFKSSISGPPTHVFRVPMQLKIITSAAGGGDNANKRRDIGKGNAGALGEGEEPIDIVMSGKACPIEASLSHTRVDFPEAHAGAGEVSETVSLRNGSRELGFRFKFGTAAHFHVVPSEGALGPLGRKEVRVVFRPNQLGKFKTDIDCIIESSHDAPTFDAEAGDESGSGLSGSPSGHTSTPLLVKFAGGKDDGVKVTTLKLSLRGICSPSKSADAVTHWKPSERALKFSSTAVAVTSASLVDGSDDPGRIPIRGYHIMKDCPAIGDSRSLSDGEIESMGDWHHKTTNKHKYWDFLKGSRVDREMRARRDRFGDDGVKVGMSRLLHDNEDMNVDPENGLTPPEPVDFSPGKHAGGTSNEAGEEGFHDDLRKIRSLFQLLQEPTVLRPKATTSTGAQTVAHPPSFFDVPLTGADLANIFTAKPALDFGKVTVHSQNSLPLNFMNSSPNRLPIHLRLLVNHEGSPDALVAANGTWDLRVHPADLVLQPMSVAGFEVTFRSDRPGRFQQKITYLVNGRYKYQVPVHVVVSAISLEMSTTSLSLDVPTTAALGVTHWDGESVFDDTISNATRLLTPNSSGGVILAGGGGGGGGAMPRTEKTVTLVNRGNFTAGFRWIVPMLNAIAASNAMLKTNADASMTRREILEAALVDGAFIVEPTSGSIPPQGTADVKVVYIPGLKPVHEESLILQVIDDAAGSDDLRVAGEMQLPCRGEISSATCTLMTSLKQGPLDLGVLPVIYSDSLEGDPTLAWYNAFAGYDLIPSPPAPVVVVTKASKESGAATKGWRVIRVKNTSPNACFFAAKTLSGSPDADITPRSGAIPGSGGVLELTVCVMPTRVGSMEDAVLISIIGGGKTIKVPFKYEGRLPEMEVVTSAYQTMTATNTDDDEVEPVPFSDGTIIGSWSSFAISAENTGSVVARAVIDLRAHPEFQLDVVSIENRLLTQSPGTGSGTNSIPSSARASSSPKKGGKQQVVAAPSKEYALKVYSERDDLFYFDENGPTKRNLMRPFSPKKRRAFNEKSAEDKGKIYVFQLQPNEKLSGEMVFRPKVTDSISFVLPVRVIGMNTVPAVVIDTKGLPSPISVSKTLINFKNKVVFRDSGTGVSHLKNVAKETLQITNNATKAINWSFDTEPLEEFDNTFRIDPWHGSIAPGAVQSVNVAFSPENTGFFKTQVPMHIDYLGHHAPFILGIQGTGVEPSLAFEPSEIFLPIVPLGSETSATFTIVNYGCERTEVRHIFSQEAIDRYGTLELQFPEGKLLKSDGEKLTVVVRFIGSIPASPGHKQEQADRGTTTVDGKKAEVVNTVEKGGPISFMTKIEFSDNNRRMFYLPLRGTSDNSLLTLQTYILRTKSEYKFVMQNPPDGHLAYEPKKAQHTSDDPRSSVKAEFLMSYEDYRRVVANDVDVLKSDGQGILHDEFVEHNKKIDAAFTVIQKEAWVTVLLQIRTGVLKRYINFTDNFRDSSPIAHLLLSHLPYLSTTHFAYFLPVCTTVDQLESNARITNAALADLFNCPNVLLPVEQLVNGESSLEVILLLLFLYQTLPSFLPKSTIEFKGGLHDRVCRGVEITNTSMKSITYFARMEGSADFELADGGSLTVNAKTTIKIPVQFTSRFAATAEGRLSLFTKKMGLNNSSIMVFDLKGYVDPPVPRRLFKVDAPLYCVPPVSIDVEISSPIVKRGRFKVTLRQGRRTAPLLILHKGKPATEIAAFDESGYQDNFSPPAFRTVENELILEGSQTVYFPITFQPFDAGHHECILHFCDPSVGEFFYQIDGRATAPQTVDLMWTCKASVNLEKPIRVTPVNTAREKALYSVLQAKVQGKTNGKVKINAPQVDGGKDVYQLPKKPLRYKVEYLSPFFSGPSEITLKPSVETGKEKKGVYAIDSNYTELPVVFAPKLPGKYSCKIVLSGLEASDVRVFSILGVAISEGSKAELDFVTPARQAITQDIPIVNKTEEDWSLKAILQGPAFSGPHSIIAKARSTTPYSITFKPMRACEVVGMLTLSNLQTAQKHVYHLRGVGQEPLPEEHREIECAARDKIRETFKVTNHTDRDAEYDVVTDIPNASGLRRIFVPAGQSVDHVLEIQAKRTATSTQLVTYVNRNDQSFVWYTVKMDVRPPPCEDTVVLATQVRKAVATELVIRNPLATPVTFTVTFEGDGLVGPDQLNVDADSEATYTLVFAPVLSNVTYGKLCFQNDIIGEFWYELRLEATEAQPIILPEMRAALGKCAVHTISIENIFSTATVLELQMDESSDFQINYPPQPIAELQRRPRSAGAVHVTCPGFEKVDIQIMFWPSSVTEPRYGVVRVLSSTIGNQVYHTQGMGLLPEPMEETVVRSILHQPTTTVLTFFNPLMDPVPVTISIRNEELGGGTANVGAAAAAKHPNFSLMIHRKARYNVGSLDRLDIPFTYTPTKMDRSIVSIIVEMGTLKWIYPITGMPDAPLTAPSRLLECRSRERMESDFEVKLPGFLIEPEEIPAGEESSVNWGSRVEWSVEHRGSESVDFSKLLSLSVKDFKMVEGEGLAILFTVGKPHFCRIFVFPLGTHNQQADIHCIQALFTPVRPSEHTIEILVTQTSTGARWKFPARLVAHLPLIDDVIVIEGAINKTNGVSFELKNTSERDRHFKAFFTKESPGEFDVKPSHGVLVPDSRRTDGCNRFVVSYRASSYGKNLVGTLVIAADDISWSYEVRGVTPKTRHPSADARYSVSSSGGMRLPMVRTSDAKQKQRNFVQDNVNSVK